MAEESGLLCLRRGRNMVLCPGAGGLELGSQGRWGLGPEWAGWGPGWEGSRPQTSHRALHL